MLFSERRHNFRMEITDLADDTQQPKPRKQNALEKLRKDMKRQLVPLRQIQEMQDLVGRYSPASQPRELHEMFEPKRQLREMLERSASPNQFQEILDGTSIAAQARRMLEAYFPRNLQTHQAEILRSVAGLDSVGEVTKAYEKYLTPVTAQQEWIEKLQAQVLGGGSVQEFARQFERANSAFATMEAAKKSLDTLWGTFQDIDFSYYEADEQAQKEAEAAAQSITLAASGESTLKEAVDQIIAAIQAEQKPAVQLMLFLFFRKMLDWLIAGAIGAVMGYYAPQLLGESPQTASKTVKEVAREAVGAPELLIEYRYISAKVLIVRQNPRALSPAVGRLTFGKVVKLVAKDKDFALVLWSDSESGAEIQGWVFSRYLGKFN
jgi:hypothetical protein